MIAVVALTEEAARLGEGILSVFPDSRLWVQQRHRDQFPKAGVMKGGFSKFVVASWNGYSQFIFIMASGIVVRTIAPLLMDKIRDPGVVVMDEKGQFAIPLVSGHLGGANALARELGRKIGCVPVITTASDVQGIPSLDDFARENRCALENLGDLKKIAAAMLEGKPQNLYSTAVLEVDFPPHVKIVTEEDSILKGQQGGVILITEREMGGLHFQGCSHVILRPPNVIAGVGCRRGKPAHEIIQALISTLKEYKISPASLAHIATIDAKKDEPGLVETAAYWGVPLKWISREEVGKAQEPFQESVFVYEQMGVGAVAEPAAWLTAAKPRWIARKTCHNGITVALVKDEGVAIRGDRQEKEREK